MTRKESVYRLEALLTMCDFRDAFGDRVDSKLYEDAVIMAIEALEENESLAKSVNDAAELIRKLQKRNDWIPCSERMPSEPFGCIVTVMDTEPMTQAEFPNLLPYFVGYDGKKWNDGDGEQCPFEVLAWMPLPKRWEGEPE